MAQASSNLLPPSYSTPLVKPATDPNAVFSGTSFNAAALPGAIGSFLGGINAALPKFGGSGSFSGTAPAPQPTQSGPFPVSSSLQTSANIAQNAVKPASSGLISSAPTGQSTTAINPNPTNNPYYIDPSKVTSPTYNPYAAPGTAGSAAPGSTTNTSTNSNASFPGLLSLLTSTAAQGTPAVQSAIDKYQQAVQQQKALKQNLASAYGQIEQQPIPLVFQQGREQVLAKQAASQLDAAQQAVNEQQAAIGQAQTAQGQQLGALGTAAGLAQPVTQAGLLTNPQTGQPLNPGVVATAVQQASQLVQNGADVNSPQVQALLNPFGFYGAQAFTAAQQALNGGQYNPTQQSAGAQQNAAQAAQTQQNAFNLNQALQQLNVITPTVTDFLNKSGLNSQDNPEFNAALNTYYGQFLSPGNKQLFEAYMGDIKKYTSQILAANSGTIPTDVANTLANFDPSHLTVSQLKPYLDGLAQLGGNQISVLQQQQQATGGSAQAYSGTPTGTNTNAIVAPQITPSSITTQNPVIQALIGGTLNFTGGVTNTLTGLASHFF